MTAYTSAGDTTFLDILFPEQNVGSNILDRALMWLYSVEKKGDVSEIRVFGRPRLYVKTNEDPRRNAAERIAYSIIPKSLQGARVVASDESKIVLMPYEGENLEDILSSLQFLVSAPEELSEKASEYRMALILGHIRALSMVKSTGLSEEITMSGLQEGYDMSRKMARSMQGISSRFSLASPNMGYGEIASGFMTGFSPDSMTLDAEAEHAILSYREVSRRLSPKWMPSFLREKQDNILILLKSAKSHNQKQDRLMNAVIESVRLLDYDRVGVRSPSADNKTYFLFEHGLTVEEAVRCLNATALYDAFAKSGQHTDTKRRELFNLMVHGYMVQDGSADLHQISELFGLEVQAHIEETLKYSLYRGLRHIDDLMKTHQLNKEQFHNHMQDYRPVAMIKRDVALLRSISDSIPSDIRDGYIQQVALYIDKIAEKIL
jgi:hypothetical protein